LVPGQLSELRALDVGGRRAVHGYFNDPAAMAAQAAAWDAAGAKGVYFTPNPLRPDLISSRTSAKKEDVIRRHWFLVDVDPNRGPDCSSNEIERLAAWTVLDRCCGTLDGAGMAGSVIGDSGNGWHVSYPIDLPNDDNSQELIKAVLKGLQRICGTDHAQVDCSCHDAPRIWKLYGTCARKGQPTPDRPHRYAQLIEGRPWDELTAAANTGTLSRMLALWAHIENLKAGRPTGDLIARAKAYIAKIDPAVSGQHGHDQTFRVACVLVKDFGLTVDQALEAIRDWNARCQPPWTDRDLRHKLADAAKRPGPVGTLGDEPQSAPSNGHGDANGNGSAHVGTNGTGPTHARFRADDVATIDDLIRKGAEIRWLWFKWFQLGVLTALAAEGGAGKTRFCVDIVRRVQNAIDGLPSFWPDNTPIDIPADWTPQRAVSFWVLADNNHDEFVTLTQSFGIRSEHARLNASRAEPYEGVTLQSSQDLIDLEARIEAVRPLLVFIDTVGNSTGLNLCTQEDAKSFYQPLQRLAQRRSCVMVCLTHLSANGTVLGRRTKEKVRVLLQMDQPNPDDPRRKLSVTKTNSKYPPPLWVTMGDSGNTYDDKLPQGAEDRSTTSKRDSKKDLKKNEVCAWLRDQLKNGARRVQVIRIDAETAGYSIKQLYQARDAIAEEFEAQGRKWWKLKTETNDA
jgi:hypothetical protein